ncbi:ABC transporter ATP-binding protein [Erwinia typographi]|uniref:ABC transporter ATP-binding protein n=1 Tax=Erwinia typographi TaxID=371042 RepID=UPI000A8BAEF6
MQSATQTTTGQDVRRRTLGAELRMESITKRYGGAAAVDNLDLIVKPGEFVTLLGSSGSGKTTALMMMAGFTAPSAGQILINGYDVTELPPAKRNLGVVFQHYSLFPHMTVAANLAFPLEMRGMGRSEIRQRVHQALEMVKLAEMGQRYPRQLSGGQQQRIALARALIFEPQALLMDEPLGALDKNLREHMQLEIKRLHTELGASIVFVTHDQEEALTLSDRVAVMQNGRIAQIDAPDMLYERPQNRWVAEFVGQSNFIGGVIEQAQGQHYRMRLDSGETLAASGVNGLKVGGRAMAVLRPEKILLTQPEGATSTGMLSATVSEVLYLGHTVKATVRLADGMPLLVSAQNRDLQGALRPGAHVGVSWQPSHLWLIDAEAAE